MFNFKLLNAISVIIFTVLASCSSVLKFVSNKTVSATALEPLGQSETETPKRREIKNELYGAKDLAGIEACKQAMEKTKEWWGEGDNRKWKRTVKGVEYYGYICKTKDGLYGYSPPKEGTHPEHLDENFNGSTGVIGTQQAREVCRAYFGQDAIVVGWYHSHIRSFSKFSKSDEFLTNMMNITGYLANKSGALGGTRVFKLEPTIGHDKSEWPAPYKEITKLYKRL